MTTPPPPSWRSPFPVLKPPVLALSLKIITQCTSGHVFRLGRLRPVYEPGLHTWSSSPRAPPGKG